MIGCDWKHIKWTDFLNNASHFYAGLGCLAGGLVSGIAGAIVYHNYKKSLKAVQFEIPPEKTQSSSDNQTSVQSDEVEDPKPKVRPPRRTYIPFC